MQGLVAYVLSKKGITSALSGITSTTYDYNNSELTITTNTGVFPVTINNGMTQHRADVLDGISLNDSTGEMEYNGNNVVTDDKTASGDIDFSLNW